jgi:hypothetical protein
MDDIRLVATLRPAPPPEADQVCPAARARLTAAYRTPQRPRPVMLATGAATLAGAALTAVIIAWPATTSHTMAEPLRIVTAAWTVQVNHDLTVTITISQLRDPAGLQRALRQEGVPAIVRYTPLVTEKVDGQEVTGPACQYRWPESAMVPAVTAQSVIVSETGPGSSPQSQSTPVSGTPPETTPVYTFTIRPEAMPKGSVIFIQDSFGSSTPAQAAPVPYAFGLSLLASDHLPRCVPLSEWLTLAGQKLRTLGSPWRAPGGAFSPPWCHARSARCRCATAGAPLSTRAIVHPRRPPLLQVGELVPALWV